MLYAHSPGFQQAAPKDEPVKEAKPARKSTRKPKR
ncbi:hypothetical protein SAMN05444163_8066 [Bradyrhizobium ottawaense]|uniref:Uncharacterized protein n=1 Tax=Bradyrhizobium ottawaense TaxID=931866 RepID=A0ABY0QH77_9BRAD|nr:hypothetical protein SAMN05444163_8066 [Bradyrhizobium ottawaense]